MGTPFWRTWRSLNAGAMRVLLAGTTALASLVLSLLFYYVGSQGMKAFKLTLFTQLPVPPGEPGGGVKNAIVGTLVLVGLASAIGIPIGIGGAVYLSEFGRTRLGGLVRFCADVLSGIPSVVIGMFAYAMFVLPFGHFSAASGGAALGVMMIPTITRTTEEMLRLVPVGFREASLALGGSRWRTALSVVLPAARAGVVTGIMVAVARVAGETAPLLFTAFGSDVLSMKLTEPISAMTLRIYQYAVSPYQDWIDQAWATALVLMLIVFVVSLIARVASRSRYNLRNA
jgi:phosphate transport system permease protein